MYSSKCTPLLSGSGYGQRTQVLFIDGILNEQRYCDKILRPIVVPFIHDHHLMFQHDNTRPHVARICTQFMEAELPCVSVLLLQLTDPNPYCLHALRTWQNLHPLLSPSCFSTTNMCTCVLILSTPNKSIS